MPEPKKIRRAHIKYSPEVAARVCERVATHPVGLRKLCDMYDDMPDKEAILDWRYKYPDFAANFNISKQFQAEIMAEEMNDLCEVPTYFDRQGIERVDAGRVACQKLKVDSIKWQAARLAPRMYGDRSVVETTVKHEENIQDLK